jgi:hypothetical protein
MRNLKFYLLIFTISSSVILLNFMLLPKEKFGKDQQLFENFISNFDKSELPYTIEIPTVEIDESGEQEMENTAEDEKKMIGIIFSAFVPDLNRANYSRMPPSRYYFKDVIFENESFVLVTYGVQSYRGRIPNTVDEYVLASYSKNPKLNNEDRLLSIRTIAKNDYFEILKSTIGKDLVIKTVRWEIDKPEEEISKEGNTERFKIAEDGKIKVIMAKKAPQQKAEDKIIIRAN